MEFVTVRVRTLTPPPPHLTEHPPQLPQFDTLHTSFLSSHA